MRAVVGTCKSAGRRGPVGAMRVAKQKMDSDADETMFSPELTDFDQAVYRRLVSTELSDGQIARLSTPADVYARQDSVIAVHWHPEFIPLPVIERRIAAMFPGRARELIIPTQHNVMMSYGPFTGVEVDCYSPEFNRKVQLLLHFANERAARADVLRGMLEHTFKYRTGQLFDFINTILEPSLEERLQEAAETTGADERLIAFVRMHVRKLKTLLERNESSTPKDMIKNKLIPQYLDHVARPDTQHQVNHAKIFLTAVKRIVKREFTLRYFYRTQEVIEEARRHGAGIIIPHPEQFWPILLADYDVDGIEVWNPQSQEYTDFLIGFVNRRNRVRADGARRLLVFMGDDCHMGEKAKDPALQDPEKAGREIGLQPAWDDLNIRKSLILGDFDRPDIIREYTARLT